MRLDRSALAGSEQAPGGSSEPGLSRRGLLRTGAALGGGLLLSIGLPREAKLARAVRRLLGHWRNQSGEEHS